MKCMYFAMNPSDMLLFIIRRRHNFKKLLNFLEIKSPVIKSVFKNNHIYLSDHFTFDYNLSFNNDFRELFIY